MRFSREEYIFLNVFNKFSSIIEALISNEHGVTIPKETIVVRENGKVLTDIDDMMHRSYGPGGGVLSDYYENKTNRQLKLKKKLYEFYTAPITKFWANAVSNLFFSNLNQKSLSLSIERKSNDFLQLFLPYVS